MEKEIRELIANNTWEYVRVDKVPKGRRALKSKWVYKIKYNKDGTIERFKSRFVVCGYSQRHGVDYDQAFSATMRMTSFRVLLALCVQLGMTIEHFDVSNAFTQANFDSEVFVQPAQGFEQEDEDGTPFVLKLIKALASSHQESRPTCPEVQRLRPMWPSRICVADADALL